MTNFTKSSNDGHDEVCKGTNPPLPGLPSTPQQLGVAGKSATSAARQCLSRFSAGCLVGGWKVAVKGGVGWGGVVVGVPRCFCTSSVHLSTSPPPPPPPPQLFSPGRPFRPCLWNEVQRARCVCVCMCVCVRERESLPQLNDKKELIPQMDLMTGDFHATQCGRLSPEFLRTLQLCRQGDLNSRWVVGELNIADYINMSHKAGEESWQKH